MTPRSFDQETCREMVGDERARAIEAKAREDADSGRYSPPAKAATSYWGQCQEDFASLVYGHQFKSRLERNARKRNALEGK